MKSQTARNSIIFFVVIYLCLLVAYFPQLNGQFIGDDVGRIQDIPAENSFSVLHALLGDRPLLIASVWVDRFIFGFDVLGMRVENLLWLSLLLLVTRLLINELADQFKIGINPLWRDGMLLLFALHPLNTQAVGHVIQRGILLSSLFGLISTWLLMFSRGNPKHIAWKISVLSWCLALMAKPNIAFLPLWWASMLFLLKEKKQIKWLAVHLMMLSIPVISYVWGEYNIQTGEISFGKWSYFLTQGRAIFHYFSLMFFPASLYFMHDLPISRPHELWPGLVLWLSYFCFLLVLWRKSKNVILNLLITGGFLSFLPESSVFIIMHPFFEHRAFVPFLFFIAGLSTLQLNFNRFKIVSFITALSLVYGTLTFQRSRQVSSYSKWVLSELRPQTCVFPYFVYYVTHVLIKRGEFESARQALKQTNGCVQDAVISPLLRAELNIATAEKIEKKDLNAIKDILHADNMVLCTIRNLANAYVSERLYATEGEGGICMIEELLSHQLRFMSKNTRGCNSSLQTYLNASNYCLRQLQSNSKTKNSYQALKIRTIKFSYFDQEDHLLKMDLESKPGNEQIKYLLEIYNNVMSDKKRAKERKEGSK